MDTQYLIRKIEECPYCKGDGYQSNPEWQALISEHAAVTHGQGVAQTLADWDRRVKATWPYGDPPPEEEPCCECEGEGKIETWVSLTEALTDLGSCQSGHE